MANSRDRRKLRRAMGLSAPEPTPMSTTPPKAMSKSAKSTKGFNRADSWTVLGLLVGILTVVIVPPLPLKVTLLAGVCLGVFRLCIYSHWTRSWPRLRQRAAASAVVVLLIAI